MIGVPSGFDDLYMDLNLRKMEFQLILNKLCLPARELATTCADYERVLHFFYLLNLVTAPLRFMVIFGEFQQRLGREKWIHNVETIG